MIIYLHGFRSSPHSTKTQLLQQRMQQLGRAQEYSCPQLPASPKRAIELAQELIQQSLQTSTPAQLTLIGSSLGGYYATWLAEQTACKAVLLNPAVTPAQDLAAQVGSTTNYHDDTPFIFKAEYLDELQAYTIPKISQPERYLLIAATGDELLNWKQMTAHYPGAQQIVIQGSDHGLSDFPDYLDQVLRFANVPL